MTLHFDAIFITGCTGSCHFDNFQCSQWWKFHRNWWWSHLRLKRVGESYMSCTTTSGWGILTSNQIASSNVMSVDVVGRSVTGSLWKIDWFYWSKLGLEYWTINLLLLGRIMMKIRYIPYTDIELFLWVGPGIFPGEKGNWIGFV